MNVLHKKFRRAIVVFAALSLLTAMLASPAFATATRLDPSHPCSITISVNNLELADASADAGKLSEALKKLPLKADVWLVATVDDDVHYTLTDAFNTGITVQGYKLDDLNSYKKSSQDPELTKKAELAAAIYGAAKGIKNETPKEGTPEEEAQNAITPGYTVDIVDGTGSLTDLRAGYYLVVPQEVRDEEYLYTFAPSLVAIPYPGIVGGQEEGTAGYEDWIYDVEAKLKPERELRKGKAVIRKHLTGYNETLEGAEFIFTVTGRRDGKLVYSNVVTLSFDGITYDKEYVIYDLPVGTVVEVEEAYSGSCYSLTGSSVTPDNVVVVCDTPETADDAIVFSFTNSPNNDVPHGTSVLNHYEEGTDGSYAHTNEFTDSTKEPSQNE